MDAHSLDCLDFARIREILGRYAATPLGRGLAETIKPAQRQELIARWLAQVEEMRVFAADAGFPPFAGITDVRDIVRNCAPPLRVSVEDVARVGDALQGTHAISVYLLQAPESCPELRHLRDRIGDFRTVADRIRAVINERGEVRDEASPKIRRLRREIDEARIEIQSVVERLLHEPAVRRLLQYANHTFHGDRLVLPLRAECRGRLPGIVHRTSDSGATIYVEPAQAVELNNRISNLRGEEQEEINRLLWELAHEIYLNGKEIIRTLEGIAVLDLIVAKIRFAKEFSACCPTLSTAGLLSVRGARHPLLVERSRTQEAAGQPPLEVVPIDYRLGDEFDLLIITGPNTGGKTVTLKTVGLLCLMVQSGLPVPVDPGATFPIFHQVLIDIGDEQSLQQSLSTFSAHLTRQMDMLRRAGPTTLVLLDELGAGTDPDEGAAIGRAILDELLRLRARCIVTTHLGALKAFALTRPRSENGSVEFDIQTLRPTYRLRIGEAGQSNAIDIAQRLGMPRRLVIAARRNLSKKARAMRAVLQGADAAKRDAESARTAAERARIEAQQAVTQADLARRALETQQADFQAWLQRVIHLQPGDRVRVRHVDKEGKVVRVRLDRQRVEVAVGAMSIEVPLGDILPPDVPAPPEREPPPTATPPRRPDPRPGRDAPPAAESRNRPPRVRNGPPRPPEFAPLSDAELAALQPGAEVIAKRFHRPATVVRVIAPKKVVVVTIGALEVEVPFSGLALPPARADGPRNRAAQNAVGPRIRSAPLPADAAPESPAADARSTRSGDAGDTRHPL